MASHEKVIHEVIVIGGGLMGSAAAWHLSNYGKKVLLLEKQASSYSSGSSKGAARIVRSSNIENDELWSYLHNSSVKEVEKLIRFLNRKGTDLKMENVYTTSPVSYIGRLEELDQLLVNLKKQDVNFEVASTIEQAKSKFGVNLKKNTFLQREFNSYSGTFNPQVLMQYLHKAVTQKGGQIWYNVNAERIELKDKLYSISVVDSKGMPKVLYAKQLISAAGPYTGKLLTEIAPYFDKLIHPQRVFLVFMKIKNELFRSLTAIQKQQLKNGFPLIDRSWPKKTDEFFAMIENCDPQGNPTLKAGGHFQRSYIPNLDAVWQQELCTEEINWAKEKIRDYLAFLNLPVGFDQLNTVDTYSCVYSLTATEVPYVTPAFKHDKSKDENLVVIAGMSGIGAKGALCYGRIAANLLTGKKQEDHFYKTAVSKLGYERLATSTLS
ncbi:MAG: FAD-dependent oxidoreductase [Maribacter sp.]|uniref:NAD(P)/FAD-dependent oxidoreductase n=1 Tax=Maribacter sp. TaxID=1897614 RepID=UPI00329A35D2